MEGDTHAFASHMFNSNHGPWNKESRQVIKGGWEVRPAYSLLESLTLQVLEENSKQGDT